MQSKETEYKLGRIDLNKKYYIDSSISGSIGKKKVNIDLLVSDGYFLYRPIEQGVSVDHREVFLNLLAQSKFGFSIISGGARLRDKIILLLLYLLNKLIFINPSDIEGVISPEILPELDSNVLFRGKKVKAIYDEKTFKMFLTRKDEELLILANILFHIKDQTTLSLKDYISFVENILKDIKNNAN